MSTVLMPPQIVPPREMLATELAEACIILYGVSSRVVSSKVSKHVSFCGETSRAAALLTPYWSCVTSNMLPAIVS
jgi:hypothetical protein